jgi:hypothetical protein
MATGVKPISAAVLVFSVLLLVVTTAFLLTGKTPIAFAENQQDSSSELSIAMPVEYVNYTITKTNGTLWATVDGTYPMHIPSDWVNQELPMVYPTPPETTNITIQLDGKTENWDNYSHMYSDAVHYTYLGNWNMIITTIQPNATDFLLTIHYQHPIQQANGTYLFLYDLNISPYLSDTSTSSIAHFNIKFETNASNIQIYTVPGDSSENRNNTKTQVNFTTSEENNAKTITFTITSNEAKPVPGDELIIFENQEAQVPELDTWMAILVFVAFALTLVFKNKKRRKPK